MVSFRRHFVPNPVQFHYRTRSSLKRRRPLFIHTGYDAEGQLTAASYSPLPPGEGQGEGSPGEGQGEGGRGRPDPAERIVFV